MATQKDTKLKTLIRNIKPGTIVLASWLKQLGISGDLQKYYINNGWLQTVARGAFKKPDDNVDWKGGVYTLQSQLGLKVTIGATTALSLQGFAHYLRLQDETLFLFSPYGEQLPKWFTKVDWGNKVIHQQSNFLPLGIAVRKYENNYFDISISSPERAILECIYLSPKYVDLLECYHLVENLVNVRPKLMQELLLVCKSVKVKRLFLFMAEKAKHQWFDFLDLEKINLGKGDRQITKGGVYISKYQITIPKELLEL